MAKRTIVMLEITDDNEERKWWNAVGLPPPWEWSTDDDMPDGVFVKEIFCEEVKPDAKV